MTVVLLLLLVPGVPIAGDDVTLPDLVPLAAHPCGGLLLLLDGDRGSGHILEQEMLIVDNILMEHNHCTGISCAKYVEDTALYL